MPRILRYSANPNNNEAEKSYVKIPDGDEEFIPFGQSPESPKIEALDPEEEEEEKEIGPTPQELAEIEAAEILHTAHEKADKMVADAMSQIDEVKEQARAEAFDEVIAQKAESISNVLKNMEDTLEKIETEGNSFIEEYEQTVSTFAVSIASSILKHELNTDPLAMCELVENAIETVKDAKWAVLTLSSDLVPLVELLQSELADKCPTIVRLEVVGKPVSKGTCLIDSPQGIVDASISTQIRNLLHRFSQIQQKRGQE